MKRLTYMITKMHYPETIAHSLTLSLNKEDIRDTSTSENEDGQIPTMHAIKSNFGQK